MALPYDPVSDFFSGIASPTAPQTGPAGNAVTSFFSSLPSQSSPTPIQKVQPVTTQKSVTIPDIASFIKQAPNAVLSGLDLKKIGQSIIAGAKMLPGTLQQAGGIILSGLVKQKEAFDTFYNPIKRVMNVPQYAIDTQLQEKTLQTAQALREAGTASVKTARETYGKTYTPSSGFQGLLEQVAFNLPQVAVTTGLSLATGIITKNPALATALGISTSYGLGASEVYSQARESGLSDQQALPLSQVGGVVIGALDFAPIADLIKKSEAVEPIKKSIIKRIAQGIVNAGEQGLFEGVTEALQEIVGNAIELTYSEDKSQWKLYEGITEAGLVGAILGGMSDVTLSGVIGIQDMKGKTIEKNIQKALETPQEQRTTQQQEIVDTLLTRTMTPDEAISYVVDNDLGKTPEGKQIMLVASQAKQQNESVTIIPASDGKSLEISIGTTTPLPSRPTETVTTPASESQKPVEEPQGRGVEESKEEPTVYSIETKASEHPDSVGEMILSVAYPADSIKEKLDILAKGKGKDGFTFENFKRLYAPTERDFTIAKGLGVIIPTQEEAWAYVSEGTMPKYESIPSVGEIAKDRVEAAKQRQGKRTDLKIEYATTLSKEEDDIQKRFGEYLETHYEEAKAKYKEVFGKVLNTDNARELSKDYAPGGINAVDEETRNARSKYAAAVHEPASAFIKRMFDEDLATLQSEGKMPVVMFTAGGTGAGKSTSIKQVQKTKEMHEAADIVYDTNLNNFDSAKKKIDKVLDMNGMVGIAYVHRHPLEALVQGAFPRAMRFGRTVPMKDHIATHIGGPETLKKLMAAYKNNPDVEIQIVNNTRGKGNAILIPETKQLDFTKQVKYNEAELKPRLMQALEEQYELGKKTNNDQGISQVVYEGTKGRTQEKLETDVPTVDAGSNGKPQRSGDERKVTPSKEEPKGTGRKKKSALYERIKETLSAEYAQQERTYNELSLDDQADKVVALIQDEPKKAVDIARGFQEPPLGMTQNAVAVALAQIAREKGDMDTAADLWTKTSLRSTRLGQEIVSLRGDFSANEPLNVVRKILSIRMDRVAAKYTDIINQLKVSPEAPMAKKVDALVKDQAKKAKQQLTKQQLRIQSAQEIINQLRCK